MPPSESRPNRRGLIWALIAWIPFAFLWALFNVITFEVPLAPALIAGVNAIGWAAILGIGVWQVTRLLPWPAQLTLGFYLKHVGLGILFSFLWLVLAVITGAIINGDPLTGIWPDIQAFFAWRMLAGLWLYGLIAGVVYATRVRRKVEEQARAAAEAQALAVQSQLDGLRARLNPHFFFNALNALSGLIHQDPNRADDALDQIAQLVRRSLAADPAVPILLSEEWQFTMDYLELERLRLGDRLRVEASMEESSRTLKIPPLSLQPLVENAVLHAIAPRIEGGTIHVQATLEDRQLRLGVMDDGPGPPAPASLQKGHGLDLLQRRLAALYGHQASLHLSTSPAGGCKAEIIFAREVLE